MLRKIKQLDNLIVEKIAHLHNPVLNKIMIIFTKLGNGAFIWWITLSFPFLVIDSTRTTGIYLTIALGVTYVTGELIIKPIFSRTRPSTHLDDHELIIKRPKDYSFPSGHTASSFTAATVTVLMCPLYIFIPVLIGALIISFSRMYLRVHYFSDVICGAFLGISSGIVCVFLCSRFLPDFF